MDNVDLEKELEKKRAEYVGIEYEENDSEENDNVALVENPFDADKIRIDQQMLSLKYIVELMAGELLDTNPGFQRKSVWKEKKRKTLLIESLMLRIPIPAFYFYENEDSKYQVIDGQQRLLTIFEYLNNQFSLSGLEYLGESCNNKLFKDLDVKYQQRIYRTQLAVNILDARSPKRVIYDIFRRVNTGGVGLNPQEMRNAICKEHVRKFLVKCTQNKNYLLATRNKINDNRLDSQEMALRFFAFFNAYDYDNNNLLYNFANIAEMLDEAIERLNLMKSEELDDLYCYFDEAMSRAYRLFGKYCFSKIFTDKENKIYRNLDYINKSLYSSFPTLLLDSNYDIQLENYQECILENLAFSLQNNEFYNSITMGTGDKRRVYCNFYYSKEVLKNCITK